MAILFNLGKSISHSIESSETKNLCFNKRLASYLYSGFLANIFIKKSFSTSSSCSYVNLDKLISHFLLSSNYSLLSFRSNKGSPINLNLEYNFTGHIK